MRHRIYLHIVWTTRERKPQIDAALAAFLTRFLPAVALQERACVLAIGIVRTHLHLAVRIEPTASLPRLLQRWKGGSAVVAVKEGVIPSGKLQWARAYNVESVSVSALADVIRYVRTQPAHHPKLAIEGWVSPELRPPAGGLKDGLVGASRSRG